MRHFIALAAALAGPIAATAAQSAAAAVQSPSPAAAAESVIAADRAFSTSGESRPLADSLSAMFDADVIMPLPSGTFAKGKAAVVAALKANPANLSAKARWAPVRAGISADGQQGFTYGFMTIRDEGKPERRAKYLAYWVKRPEGWRVAAYKRAGSPDGPVDAALRPPALPVDLVPPTTDAAAIEAHRASLAAAEKAFSDRSQVAGVGQAFIENGSADAMNMGGGAGFTFGNQTIGGNFPAETKSPIHWAADEQVIVAGSGDLGVTIGYIRPHVAETGQPSAIPFFTVWRRALPQQPWRYVAE